MVLLKAITQSILGQIFNPGAFSKSREQGLSFGTKDIMDMMDISDLIDLIDTMDLMDMVDMMNLFDIMDILTYLDPKRLFSGPK